MTPHIQGRTEVELQNIEEDEGNENLEGLVHGPLYSSIDGTNVKNVNKSFVNAVR